MRFTPFVSALGALALGAFANVSSAVITVWSGSAYQSFDDSPFFTSTPSTYFYLEDFEDDTFTAGFSNNPGWYRVTGTQFIDSVDGDDGTVDGSGNSGGSFYSGGLNTTLNITFDAGVLGGLPTDVGFVWTDVGGVSSGTFGIGQLDVKFYDESNAMLASVTFNAAGDGLITGQTAEDRFFGYSGIAYVSRIEIVMPTIGDWEIDHIQYGSRVPAVGAVPEPSTYGAIGAGLLLTLAVWRRRRKSVKA